MYMIVPNLYIKKVSVIRDEGEFCLVRFDDGGAARVRSNRLYETKEEAEKHLPNRVNKKPHNPLGPYA